MRKKRLQKRIARLEARKAELEKRGQASTDVEEVRQINAQIQVLNEDIADFRDELEEVEAEERAAAEAAQGNGDPAADQQQEQRDAGSGNQEEQRQVIAAYGVGANGSVTQFEIRKSVMDIYEQRGQDLKTKKAVNISLYQTAEERAVNIAGGTLVVPTHYSNTATETFNEVSALIDRVAVVPLPNGNAYEKAFEVTFGEGDETGETADYNEDDPVFDYVTIGKSKITIYTEITDEATKLPNVDYQALVAKNIRIALRKRISKQIIVGDGTANNFTGIFNAPANVMPTPDVYIDIAAIDEDTLDEIVFGYGGDEEVEGEAALILNKLDLKAFSKVRGNDGHKLYKIKMDPTATTGIISSADGESTAIPYIINSVCPQLSSAGTGDLTVCMAYGKLQAYEMPVFSQVEIQESRDFKFKSGQIAYRGAVWAGGNVVKYKGFSLIRKNAAA